MLTGKVTRSIPDRPAGGSSEALSTRITGARCWGIVSRSRSRRLRVATTTVTRSVSDRGPALSDMAAGYPGFVIAMPGGSPDRGPQFLGEEVEETVGVRSAVHQDDVVVTGRGVLPYLVEVALRVGADH